MTASLISLLATFYPKPGVFSGGLVIEIRAEHGGRVLGTVGSIEELDAKALGLGATLTYRDPDHLVITREGAEAIEDYARAEETPDAAYLRWQRNIVKQH